MRALLWRRLGGGGWWFGNVGRLGLAEEREECVGVCGGGSWEEVRGRCSCWVVVSRFRIVRLDSSVLRSRRYCRRSDCPRPNIVVS